MHSHMPRASSQTAEGPARLLPAAVQSRTAWAGRHSSWQGSHRWSSTWQGIEVSSKGRTPQSRERKKQRHCRSPSASRTLEAFSFPACPSKVFTFLISWTKQADPTRLQRNYHYNMHLGCPSKSQELGEQETGVERGRREGGRNFHTEISMDTH